MVKIYKYEIDPYGIVKHKDRFVGILNVDWQKGKLYVWCLVGDKKVRESEMTFFSLPTGYEFNYHEDMHYLDSVTDGPYVWHIFFGINMDEGNRKLN